MLTRHAFLAQSKKVETTHKRYKVGHPLLTHSLMQTSSRESCCKIPPAPVQYTRPHATAFAWPGANRDSLPRDKGTRTLFSFVTTDESITPLDDASNRNAPPCPLHATLPCNGQ